MGRKLTKAAAWIQQTLFAIKQVPGLKKSPNPNIVKVLIMRDARSSFTRKGPGVTAQLRSALKDLTPAQRMVAKAKGWDRGLLKGWSDGR